MTIASRAREFLIAPLEPGMQPDSRYAVLSVLFLGYFLCYMDRMVIATALPFIAKDLQLSPFAMGGVLSAFFVGYAAMQIPGGWLADRFGPRPVISLSIIGWSIFTFLTGVATSLAVLIVIRVLFGIAEGPYPSAASKAVATWFPREQLGRANGVQLASVNIGAAIAPLLVAPWVLLWGWRSVFYFLIVPGLVLTVAASRILKDESVERLASERKPTESTLRFVQSLKAPGLLACAAALFFGNVAGWGLMNWLPTYLLQARGFHVLKTGLYASVPFLAGACGYYLGGLLSDRYFNRKRHIPIAVGFLISSGMTLVAARAQSGELAVAALVIVFLFFFMSLSGLFTLPLVLVPVKQVGGAFGAVNTVGQVAAFLSPLLIGYTLEASGSDFSRVFHLLVGLFFIASCVALCIRSPEQTKSLDLQTPRR